MMFYPGDLCFFEKEVIVMSPTWPRGDGWWYARRGTVVMVIGRCDREVVSFLDHTGRIGLVNPNHLQRLETHQAPAGDATGTRVCYHEAVRTSDRPRIHTVHSW